MQLTGFSSTDRKRGNLRLIIESWDRRERGTRVGVSLFFLNIARPWTIHCVRANRPSFSEDQIASIPSWATSACFNEIEAAVLAYTDDLVLGGGRVSDGTFKVLKEYFSDEEILELSYITCTYDMHATICKALRLEYDDVEERVKEVPIPDSGLGDIDFMKAVDKKK